METAAAASRTVTATAPTRVLLVTPPAEGGIAAHVEALARHLHGHGYEISLVCAPGSRLAESSRARELAVHELRCTLEGGAGAAFRQGRTLARIVRTARPHLVHAHGFAAGVVSAAACFISRQPNLLLTIHNYPAMSGAMRPVTVGQRLAMGFMLHQAYRVVTVSDSLRSALVAAWPQFAAKCLTIHNGVETDVRPGYTREHIRSQLAVPEDHLLVGMVARLAPQKGVAEFLRSAREVCDAYPAVTFVLAGDGPLMDEVVRLRAALELVERVRLPGFIDWAHDLIAASEVMVIPSLTEGSSLVAMEAMSRGRPVIATRVGGVPEVVADNEVGLLVAPQDSTALARAIIGLLLDAELRHRMGERGRLRVLARFDVKDMVERTKALYADCMRTSITR